MSGQFVWVANAGDETVTVINEQSSPGAGRPVAIHGPVGQLAPAGDTGNAWMASVTQLLQLQPTY